MPPRTPWTAASSWPAGSFPGPAAGPWPSSVRAWSWHWWRWPPWCWRWRPCAGSGRRTPIPGPIPEPPPHRRGRPTGPQRHSRHRRDKGRGRPTGPQRRCRHRRDKGRGRIGPVVAGGASAWPWYPSCCCPAPAWRWPWPSPPGRSPPTCSARRPASTPSWARCRAARASTRSTARSACPSPRWIRPGPSSWPRCRARPASRPTAWSWSSWGAGAPPWSWCGPPTPARRRRSPSSGRWSSTGAA